MVPATAAESMPGPTMAAKEGSWPDPPPRDDRDLLGSIGRSAVDDFVLCIEGDVGVSQGKAM